MKHETMISNLRQSLLEHIGEWLDSNQVMIEEGYAAMPQNEAVDDELHVKMADAAMLVYSTTMLSYEKAMANYWNRRKEDLMEPTSNAEPEKILFIKQKIREAGFRSLEISADFIKDTIDESSEFLAKDPLDVLTPNFARDMERLENYLNVRLRLVDGSYMVLAGT